MSERIRARRLPIELAESLTASVGDEAPTEGKNIKTRLLMELVRDVFENGLTKKQKCYIMLYYRDGLTMEQIAKRCGVNKSTVSRTVNAARRKVAAYTEKLMNIRI